MGDVKMRRENIRYEARGKSFEFECPSGFSGIEAIVCWCDANAVLANSLNDQVLQQHYIDALKSIGKDGNLVVVPEGSQPIVGTK